MPTSFMTPLKRESKSKTFLTNYKNVSRGHHRMTPQESKLKSFPSNLKTGSSGLQTSDFEEAKPNQPQDINPSHSGFWHHTEKRNENGHYKQTLINPARKKD
ncbi:hypothetical protein CDAR_117731 [Caerostris darwini]|uniref:Uncharacterized protein n=1 Tax=Caerostris darwini TaxID=1538125 RepID=A0AAV4PZL4_9ARAC|nr:hypothetical protein CDAR_117731 [Caerostris darwini]